MKFLAYVCVLVILLQLVFPGAIGQTLKDTETTMNCGPNSSESVVFVESNAAEAYCQQTVEECKDVFKVGRVDENLAFSYKNFAVLPTGLKLGSFISTSPLFITFSDRTGRPAYHSRFFLEVDRFSLIEIASSAGTTELDVDPADGNPISPTLQDEIESVYISAEFGKFVTNPVPRARVFPPSATSGTPTTNEHRKVVTYYTLLITVEKGEIIDLEWEEGCFDCDQSNCIKPENLCSVPYNECSNIDPQSAISCNLKIYVAWKGTDVNGDFLISAQRTIRNFMLFSLSLPMAQAAKTVEKLSPG